MTISCVCIFVQLEHIGKEEAQDTCSLGLLGLTSRQIATHIESL